MVHTPRIAARSRLLYICFSLVLLGVVYAQLFAHTSPTAVLTMLVEKHWRGTILFLLFSISQSMLRTWQFRLLLTAAGSSAARVPLFLVVLVRNLCSDLLPARIGTTVYMYLVHTRLNVPLAAASSSFAIAFAIDLIAIVPLVLLMTLLYAAPLGDLTIYIASGGVVLLLLVLVGLRILPQTLRVVGRSLASLRILSPIARQRLSTWLYDTAENVAITERAGIYPQVLFLGLLVRICKYTAMYFFLFALLFPRGFGIEQLPPPMVFLGLCAAEFAASMPFSPPGGFGIYEGAWTAAFSLLGLSRELAAETGISHHLFTQLYGYSLGALALLLLSLPLFRQPAAAVPTAQTPVRFFAHVAIFLTVVISTAFTLFWLLAQKAPVQ